MNSVLGAAGIAFGIALAMWLLGEGEYDGFILNNSVPVQLVSCTVACIGFALWFKIRGRQVLFCGVGAFLYLGDLCGDLCRVAEQFCGDAGRRHLRGCVCL